MIDNNLTTKWTIFNGKEDDIEIIYIPENFYKAIDFISSLNGFTEFNEYKLSYLRTRYSNRYRCTFLLDYNGFYHGKTTPFFTMTYSTDSTYSDILCFPMHDSLTIKSKIQLQARVRVIGCTRILEKTGFPRVKKKVKNSDSCVLKFKML